MNTDNALIENENQPSCLGAVMQCSILVTKHDGSDYWKDEKCKKIAKFTIFFKMSKKGDIHKKHCCTQHKTKLLKEIENDSFAELVSVENIA